MTEEKTFNKRDIQYIRARERGGDYAFEGIKNMGYSIMIPYKDKNLLLRFLREAWFRLHLPARSIWYNPKVKDIKAANIIVKDPLITKDFLEYIRKLYPNKRIILEYDNRVKNSKKTGLNPQKLKSGTAELWSYDMDDCKEYGMKKKHDFYLDIYRNSQSEKLGKDEYKYDILYLGRDKGRAEEILQYERIFQKLGLKTYFHICADRSMFVKKKPYYKAKIKYTEYLELQSQSRAILNIMPEGQYSITPRDMEAAFNNVKEITNNKGVKNLEFYSSDRYFVLGEDNMDSLCEFLNKPIKPVEESIIKNYTFDKMVEAMILDV